MSGIRNAALNRLRRHTIAIEQHEQARSELIAHALGVGCSISEVADAAGLSYDALRMRLSRRRRAQDPPVPLRQMVAEVRAELIADHQMSTDDVTRHGLDAPL